MFLIFPITSYGGMGDAYIYNTNPRTAIEAVSFLLLEKACAVFGAEA